MIDPKVIIAMDFSDGQMALALAKQLSPHDCRLKIGKELFTKEGPKLIESLMLLGFDVFLDLKFHDIPNTVAGAIKSAASLGIWMINVHALGGRKMMQAAADAIANSQQRPLLIAVTILTSLSADDLLEIGFVNSPLQQVKHLASLANDCGLDGVVCSAQEATEVKAATRKEFLAVTPGIRLKGNISNDQVRIMTPEKALQKGSDYLVIGRSITQANNPVSVLAQINQSIAESYL